MNCFLRLQFDEENSYLFKLKSSKNISFQRMCECADIISEPSQNYFDFISYTILIKNWFSALYVYWIISSFLTDTVWILMYYWWYSNIAIHRLWESELEPFSWNRSNTIGSIKTRQFQALLSRGMGIFVATLEVNKAPIYMT